MGAPPYDVLIVDNQRLFRQGIRLLLERSSDIRVVGDTDATRAVAMAITSKPIVVLIDLRLPRFEDGSKILAQIRESVPGTHIVVLTIEGGEASPVYDAFQNGALGCVLKSTSNITEVEEAIRQVAQGHPYVSPSALESLIATIASKAERSAEKANASSSEELSPREDEVLELVAVGYTNRQIAEKLIISESTVRSHLHNILEKLHLENRVQAAAFSLLARSNGSLSGNSTGAIHSVLVTKAIPG